MKNNIDIDAVKEVANQLAGTLDLLATAHATAAANDPCSGETKSLAATFGLLHASAARLAELLAAA